MDFAQAIILSLVEGLTEFLPISSTGHLVLTSYLLKIPQTGFVKSFEIIIQLGAIAAVGLLYFKYLLFHMKIWKTLFLAFLPTATVGLLFYKFIKQILIGDAFITVTALIIGGVLLIVFEKTFKPKTKLITSMEEITLKNALIIGVAQSLSVVPGVSRAAATILGGLFSGLDKKTAVEFSFLLALPTMLAATLLDLINTDFLFSPSQLQLIIIGVLASFITALAAIKIFLRFIQKNTFVSFGVYRIILGVLFWLTFLR